MYKMGINHIKQELDKRFKEDQEACKKKDWKKALLISRINSKWLKNIIKQYGCPSRDIVGTYGEQAAWLIAQHSNDLKFQKTCLKLLKTCQQTKERKRYIAYLTDRILISSGKKQIYGTQFNGSEPFPIKDIKNLNKRRKNASLESFNEYKNFFIKNQ